MVIASVPTARVLQNLKDALSRSRAAEADLQRYQEGLEETVRERTLQLWDAVRRAEDASRAKTVFFAKMNHELRTPLNAILGFSAMIATDSSLSETHRQDMAIIRSSGANLLHLIDDVLDMAKVESGSIVLQETSFEVRDLAAEVIAIGERARGAKEPGSVPGSRSRNAPFRTG